MKRGGNWNGSTPLDPAIVEGMRKMAQDGATALDVMRRYHVTERTYYKYTEGYRTRKRGEGRKPVYGRPEFGKGTLDTGQATV